MSIFRFLVRLTAVTALVVASASADAAFIAYTSQSTFNAALYVPGTDTFASLPQAPVASPYHGTAGSYGYTATATSGDTLYGVGTPGDPALSTNLSGDSILFNGFSTGLRGIGGFFFGTDTAGAFLPGQTLTLTAVDTFGATATQVLANATELSFAGFVTNGFLVSLTVSIGSLDGFATVDDLTVGRVPEPGMLALLAIGAVGVGLGRRRMTSR